MIVQISLVAVGHSAGIIPEAVSIIIRAPDVQSKTSTAVFGAAPIKHSLLYMRRAIATVLIGGGDAVVPAAAQQKRSRRGPAGPVAMMRAWVAIEPAAAPAIERPKWPASISQSRPVARHQNRPPASSGFKRKRPPFAAASGVW
jgi:hypothetical protein